MPKLLFVIHQKTDGTVDWKVNGKEGTERSFQAAIDAATKHVQEEELEFVQKVGEQLVHSFTMRKPQ